MRASARPRCSRPDDSTPARQHTGTAPAPPRASPASCARRHALLAGVALIGGRRFVGGGAVASAAVDELPLVPKAALAPGLDISQVVKGCWQLSGAHHGDPESDRTGGEAAVRDFAAFQAAGISTLDVADHYGPGEELIGQYLRQASEPGQVQVLTKACVWGQNLYTAGKGRTMEQEYVDVSRRRLGRKNLDLLQFYWHDYTVKGYVDAALRLADLQAAGKIRHIGMTNFDVPRLMEMMDAGVPIASNQVQYSMLDRRPEGDMAQFCGEKGIKLLPYGVVAGGLLSERYLGMPPKQVELNTASKGKYAQVLGEVGSYAWLQKLLGVLHDIALSHDVSIADVASRWILDKPTVGAVIIGARNTSHIADHQKLFSFQLSDNDEQEIQQILSEAKIPKGDCYSWERGGKF